MKKIDEEALAEAYNRALALEKAGDVDAAVKVYAEVLAIDPEDHGGAAVRIAALGHGETPPKAPDAYVETLFDQHAESFEDILVEQLGYAELLDEDVLEAFGVLVEQCLDIGVGRLWRRFAVAKGGDAHGRAAVILGIDG